MQTENGGPCVTPQKCRITLSNWIERRKKGTVYRLLERRNLYSVIDVPFCVKINFYILSIFFRFKEIIVMQMQLPPNFHIREHHNSIWRRLVLFLFIASTFFWCNIL